MTDGRNETREREREREREKAEYSFSPRLLSFTPRARTSRESRSNEPASLLNATQVVSRPREEQLGGS